MPNPFCSFSSSWTPDAAQKIRSLVSDQFERLLIITGNRSVKPSLKIKTSVKNNENQ